MITDEKTYKIVRKHFRGPADELIKTGLTLEEAQDHCCDPTTRSEGPTRPGSWFDAYYEE
jgi:hypothetical protein